MFEWLLHGTALFFHSKLNINHFTCILYTLVLCSFHRSFESNNQTFLANLVARFIVGPHFVAIIMHMLRGMRALHTIIVSTFVPRPHPAILINDRASTRVSQGVRSIKGNRDQYVTYIYLQILSIMAKLSFRNPAKRQYVCQKLLSLETTPLSSSADEGCSL